MSGGFGDLLGALNIGASATPGVWVVDGQQGAPRAPVRAASASVAVEPTPSQGPSAVAIPTTASITLPFQAALARPAACNTAATTETRMPADKDTAIADPTSLVSAAAVLPSVVLSLVANSSAATPSIAVPFSEGPASATLAPVQTAPAQPGASNDPTTVAAVPVDIHDGVPSPGGTLPLDLASAVDSSSVVQTAPPPGADIAASVPLNAAQSASIQAADAMTTNAATSAPVATAYANALPDQEDPVSTAPPGKTVPSLPAAKAKMAAASSFTANSSAATPSIAVPFSEGLTSATLAPVQTALAQPGASNDPTTVAAALVDIQGGGPSPGGVLPADLASAQNVPAMAAPVTASALDLPSVAAQTVLPPGAHLAASVPLNTAHSASIQAARPTTANAATSAPVATAYADALPGPEAPASTATLRKTAPPLLATKAKIAATSSFTADIPAAADPATATAALSHQAGAPRAPAAPAAEQAAQPSPANIQTTLQPGSPLAARAIVPRATDRPPATTAVPTGTNAANPGANPSTPASASTDPLAPVAFAFSPASTTTRATEAPAASATHDTAAPTRQVVPVLAELTRSPAGGAMTLRLDPEELGKVQIRIERGIDGTAAIHVAAERPETLRLLIADQQELHRTLDNAGVPQEGRSLSLTLSTPEATPASRDISFSANTGASNGSNAGTNAGGGFSNGGGGGRQGGHWHQDRTPYSTATSNPTSTVSCP